MKNFKKNEGITLIALIITVIILVILAAISVRAVSNIRIVEYATNGSKNYIETGKNENRILDDAASLIESTTMEIDDLIQGKQKYHREVERAIQKVLEKDGQITADKTGDLIKALEDELGDFRKFYLVKDDLGLNEWRIIIPNNYVELDIMEEMGVTEEQMTQLLGENWKQEFGEHPTLKYALPNGIDDAEYTVGRNGLIEVNRNEEGIWLNGIHYIHRLLMSDDIPNTIEKDGNNIIIEKADNFSGNFYNTVGQFTDNVNIVVKNRIRNNYTWLNIYKQTNNSFKIYLGDAFCHTISTETDPELNINSMSEEEQIELMQKLYKKSFKGKFTGMDGEICDVDVEPQIQITCSVDNGEFRWSDLNCVADSRSQTVLHRRFDQLNNYFDKRQVNIRTIACGALLHSQEEITTINSQRTQANLPPIQDAVSKIPQEDRGIRIVANGKEYRGEDGFVQFLIETYDIENLIKNEYFS